MTVTLVPRALASARLAPLRSRAVIFVLHQAMPLGVPITGTRHAIVRADGSASLGCVVARSWSARGGRVGVPRRVLVIEDDPALRDMLCEALASEGYQVLPSDHPVAPLDLQQLRPSLVVLDLMLGGEPEGYGWLEAVRAWRWTTRLPVLVCSGFLAPGAPAAQRVQALADATVPKPFALDQFLAAVAGCVEASAPPHRH